MEVGNIVKPVSHEHVLASGCGRYPIAYVVSVEPFQLMSEEGDMYWRCTVEREGYEVVNTATELPEKVKLRMQREGLL